MIFKVMQWSHDTFTAGKVSASVALHHLHRLYASCSSQQVLDELKGDSGFLKLIFAAFCLFSFFLQMFLSNKLSTMFSNLRNDGRHEEMRPLKMKMGVGVGLD